MQQELARGHTKSLTGLFFLDNNPLEAEALRLGLIQPKHLFIEAYKPVMQEFMADGYTLRQMARALNDKGYKTYQGLPWTKANLFYFIREHVTHD
ncbi:recombinase family protein [Nitrosococcus oceani]|uniref:recombinase family protein n=1 Tax=Nitrosococcus oceani TaxID=1229 RepID=UPI0004E88383|nr:recombinase family protein [Nitrosococcus oceani]KFI22341.1 hypothetical protein HW44_10150 [Nitrosococcus oceani]